MTYAFDGYNWLVRLERGESLVDNLKKLANKENIAGAWISGIGAAESAEIGFYDLKNKKYVFKKLDLLLEVSSLSGNLTWQDGEPVLHMHGTFSDQGLQTYGGHVKDLVVGGTLEVLLHRWYQDKLTRQKDEETGLNLLDL